VIRRLVPSDADPTVAHGLHARTSLVPLLVPTRQVRFLLNAVGFQASELRGHVKTAGVEHLVLGVSAHPGQKTLFWKREVTEARVEGFEWLWLLDSDMAFGRPDFDLAPFLRTLQCSNASVAQPAIWGPVTYPILRPRRAPVRRQAGVVLFFARSEPAAAHLPCVFFPADGPAAHQLRGGDDDGVPFCAARLGARGRPSCRSRRPCGGEVRVGTGLQLVPVR
jgi:hypothetical protein